MTKGGKGADPGRRTGAALVEQYFPTSSHNARPEAVSTLCVSVTSRFFQNKKKPGV